MVTLSDIENARTLLADHIKKTPLLKSPDIAAHPGLDVYLKAENLQRAGSFKVRGALNKIYSLTEEERARGVIAASAGNHAQGVALAAGSLGIRAVICMPEGAPISKVEATQSYGAEVVLHGSTYDDAYEKARELQAAHGYTLIHGFDDPYTIAGQGTIGLEILEQLPEVATVLVPIGGGGLIAGIALALKSLRPDVRVVGVQAAGAPAVFLSRQHGELMATQSVHTIADGIAVKQPGRLCWEIIRQCVDDVVLVDEEEIAQSILYLLERAKLMVEGAGAVGMAALLGDKVPDLRGPVCAVLSGGNIDVNIISRIIERGLVKAGRYIRISTFVPDRPGGLQELLATVARAGANVISVHHERWLNSVTIGEVEIDLALETRNARHVDEILSTLKAKGYQVSIIPPFRPNA
ncbi:MAG: threonine ammonia-lyase [Symbiobacterium sp.]|uniref:threonine ammonia-lyase n=1 Tax=Symbiobacterium sp. TaxID=1971213 RepID=UPI0034649AD3